MSSREALAELLWAEKYRPRSLDEMVNQEDIVNRMKKFVEEKNMPHLLLAGPPGTGKTTAAHCLAHDLFGENYRQYMLELNASVSRDTPILVKINGVVKRTTFDELDKIYFNKDDTLRYGDGEYVRTSNLEVLTLDKKTGKIKWGKVTWIIRHYVDKILEIKVEGGGTLKLTGNHSIMVIDENGELVEKKASEIKAGEYVLSFTTILPGEKKILDLRNYIVKETRRNKQSKIIPLDTDFTWLLGMYIAEGSLGFRKSKNLETSGQLVITIGYPDEKEYAERIEEITEKHDIPIYENLVGSGFKGRDRLTAKHIRLLHTGLARYLRREAYTEKTRARYKRIPKIIYELKNRSRIEFIRGLAAGDGTGEWNNVVRISSTSKDLLIDLVWLARISGIEASIFDNEARLIWRGSMKYKKSDLLPAIPFIKFFEEVSEAININWKYLLRHQLYEDKKSVSRKTLKIIMENIDKSKLSPKHKEKYEKLYVLVNSDIHILKVKHVKIIDYNDYVYDVSIPENNMFFAGEIPILLHNSDERGIDVIRSKVKEFARTRVPGEIPFKIVLLDEADNMTADAQQALRRLMEMYTASTRFILIANYPSKIIEPIQSRCAVFRFTPLKKEDVISRLKYIAENEKVKYHEDALEAIHEISEGDMRKAINILQAAAALGEVTVDSVYKVVGLAHPREVRQMIQLALAGKFTEARSKLRELMINYGLSGLDIIKQIHREIYSSDIKLPDEIKIMIADLAGEIQFRLVEGADDEIQLNAFLARLAFIGKKFKV
ncbi:MAG: replication protein C [Desulfurococcales archaeon ex4484_58]|nr:MAG: replication protein C [Desulfurococcales archaeon ex4484_58]